MSEAACGVNNEVGFQAFPSPSEFCHKATIEANSTKYEFSGGDFRSSTCSHLVVNDAKWLNEYQVRIDDDDDGDDDDKIIMVLESRYRLRGFSGDYEGICLYKESGSSTKLAVIDERNRTAALCDFPSSTSTNNNNNEIDLEGDDCVSYSLSADVLSNADLMDPSLNRGFEGVACDPQEQKLYIAQEKDPMAIWQLDLVTGNFEVLIPVSSREPWTDLVEDLAGVRTVGLLACLLASLVLSPLSFAKVSCLMQFFNRCLRVTDCI